MGAVISDYNCQACPESQSLLFFQHSAWNIEGNHATATSSLSLSAERDEIRSVSRICRLTTDRASTTTTQEYEEKSINDSGSDSSGRYITIGDIEEKNSYLTPFHDRK